MDAVEIVVAENLEHALERLARESGDLRPLAGGTDAMLRLESGKLRARKLLALHRCAELRGIREGPTHLEVGALTPVADLLDAPAVGSELPALAAAAQAFASPQIRNLATVGGNVANASPAADLVPPLIALGAEATLRNRGGARSLPLEALFVGPGQTRMAPDELLVAVRIPRRRGGRQWFTKFAPRAANAIAVVNFALWIDVDGDRIRAARVAYGACAPVPLRARRVEDALAGKQLDADALAGADLREAVISDVSPIDDVRGSRRYRQLLAVHALEDALRAALDGGRHAA